MECRKNKLKNSIKKIHSKWLVSQRLLRGVIKFWKKNHFGYREL